MVVKLRCFGNFPTPEWHWVVSTLDEATIIIITTIIFALLKVFFFFGFARSFFSIIL